MKILTLIGDDQQYDRFARRLVLSGYQSIPADSGEEAGRYVQRENISVVVVDCDRGGLDLLRELRCLQVDEYVYIFALVSPDIDPSKYAELAMLADEYIAKPVEPDELLARLSVVDRYLKTLLSLRTRAQKQEPIRDDLTGAFTAGTFLELLNTEWNRSQRTSKPFALALAVVDQLADEQYSNIPSLKEKALTQVALKIWASVRSYDLIGRWSEQGFALLLPETSLDGASVVADRIRQNVAGVPLHLPSQPPLSLTISMGFVQNSPDKALTAKQLLANAQDALERARVAGGNHIVFSWE